MKFELVQNIIRKGGGESGKHLWSRFKCIFGYPPKEFLVLVVLFLDLDRLPLWFVLAVPKLSIFHPCLIFVFLLPQDNGLGLFWLKQCSLGRFLQSLNWSDTWWCTLKAEKNPGCISAIGRLWGLLMATFVAIFSWNHYPDDWAELSQRYVQEANIWAVTSWRKNRWVGGQAWPFMMGHVGAYSSCRFLPLMVTR